MTVRYEIGDTRAVVATQPDGSVALVASSPPFIALRSYLPADHEHKHAEIGSEPDPATFLQTLLELTAEWGRVLAPWGSIAIELGDTYAGAQPPYRYTAEHQPTARMGGSHRVGDDGSHAGNAIMGEINIRGRVGPGWPRAKSLALIPHLYATSLAYGRNLLTGQPSPAGQWLVRNVIVWHRPNPAVGALGDKVRPSTSYITVATRSPKRWFDLDAVRTPHVTPDALRPRNGTARVDAGGRPGGDMRGLDGSGSNPTGAPPLDCWFDEHDTWTITTQPSSLAHYAMWPARLAERLILMMCPAQVCAACGAPRRRLVHAERVLHGLQPASKTAQQTAAHGHSLNNFGGGASDFTQTRTTIGWSDCGHDDYMPGVVLDPFAGTGTTLAVADLHGRDAVGIDIDERNRALYPRRREECARALFDVRPQMTGQLGLFGEAL